MEYGPPKLSKHMEYGPPKYGIRVIRELLKTNFWVCPENTFFKSEEWRMIPKYERLRGASTSLLQETFVTELEKNRTRKNGKILVGARGGNI